MRNIHLFLLLLLCAQISFTSFAQVKPLAIIVDKPYVRASIPGSNISSAYMKITNKDEKTVTLLGASSNISPRVEIHQHTMVGDLMRMRKLDAVIIKANEQIILQPSGLHFMLFDVKKPLKPQQEVELTLRFSDKKTVTIKMPVYSFKQEKSAQVADEQLSTMQHHH